MKKFGGNPLWLWSHKRSFLAAGLILSVMSYGFGLGVHQVQGGIHNNRSLYAVSQTIEKLPTPPAQRIDLKNYVLLLNRVDGGNLQ